MSNTICWRCGCKVHLNDSEGHSSHAGGHISQNSCLIALLKVIATPEAPEQSGISWSLERIADALEKMIRTEHERIEEGRIP